jgi:hypothetical protein
VPCEWKGRFAITTIRRRSQLLARYSPGVIRWLPMRLAPWLRRVVAPETTLEEFREELSRGDVEDALFMTTASWFLIMCVLGAAMLIFTLLGSLSPALDAVAQGLLAAMFASLGLVIVFTLAHGCARFASWRRDR